MEENSGAQRFGIILAIYLALAVTAFAQMQVTYRGPETEKDVRKNYYRDLLELALEKTLATHGPYRLTSSPPMNAARAEATMQVNMLPNFVAKQSVNPKRLRTFGHIPIPVDRGIVGYRIFFVSPQARERLKKVQTLADLQAFTIGQGNGWLDVEILRRQGFTVSVGSSYEGLFKMVALGRIDLFPRGANEILAEYNHRRHIPGLICDDRIALYYPLPRYFFTNKANTAFIARIRKGLELAEKDGSFKRLWQSHYQASINFVNLKKRRIFKLNNPFIQNIDDSYKQYVHSPDLAEPVPK